MDIMVLIKEDLRCSTLSVNGKRVRDLGPGLRNEFLSIFEKLDFFEIDYNKYVIILRGEEKSYFLEKAPIGDDIKTRLRKAIDLLIWSFQMRFSPIGPGYASHFFVCKDCRKMQDSEGPLYCDNPVCKSHDKWKLIYPDYKKSIAA